MIEDSDISSNKIPSLIPGFFNDAPDENGMFENGNTVLQKEQYRVLWFTSLSFFASAGYAFATGHYDLVPPAALLGLSSITYWYYPDYSWRRKLDMAVAHSALAYQLCRAYRAQNASLYYSTMAIAVSFYPMGIVAHKFDDGWLSTLFHSQLHLIGNMASFILYSGYIPPFWETVSYLGAVFPLNNKT